MATKTRIERELRDEFERRYSARLQALSNKLADQREECEEQREESERLRLILDAVKRHWQFGVQDIDNPWKRKMAMLLGDVEGLQEAAIRET